MTLPPSVNFHLLSKCNMKCVYCFAPHRSPLNEANRIDIIQKLGAYYKQHGVQNPKITFVGGEPLLCPDLPKLIRTAKRYGFTTMVVTNGSLLSEDFLSENQGVLDWIGLSIDSLSDRTNDRIGRCSSACLPKREDYANRIDYIHKYGYKLKINTVVSRMNLDEDFNDFIAMARPDRWKVLQVLPVQGVNTTKEKSFLIKEEEFRSFLDRHSKYICVSESNEEMRGSYAMIAPDGCFFDNLCGYTYSSPILTTPIEQAFEEIGYTSSAYNRRGANYDWKG